MRVFRIFFNILFTIWLAFLTAAAIQSHRPASLNDVAGLESTGKAAPDDLLDQIEQSVWHRNTPLVLNEAEVNRYLAVALNGHQTGVSRHLARFDRVALNFQPGICRVIFLWNSGGMRSTASLDFTVTRDSKKFVIVPVAGSYGRLPVFRGALAILIPACRSLGTALDADIRAILQMNQIRFEKNKIVLDPRLNAGK